MPIYEYICPTCGRFEVIQKLNEKRLRFCPTCASRGSRIKVSKSVSPAAFHLKGSGWYKTDYCSKPSNGNAHADKPTSGETSAATSSAEADSKEKPSKSTEAK